MKALKNVYVRFIGLALLLSLLLLGDTPALASFTPGPLTLLLCPVLFATRSIPAQVAH